MFSPYARMGFVIQLGIENLNLKKMACCGVVLV